MQEEEEIVTKPTTKKRPALTESFSGILKCKFCKNRSATRTYFNCECVVLCDECYVQILKIKSGFHSCVTCDSRFQSIELQKKNHRHTTLTTTNTEIEE